MEQNANAQTHVTKNKPFQYNEPRLQLDCLTTVKRHPFSSLNTSAVAQLPGLYGMLLLFSSCMLSSLKESISPRDNHGYVYSENTYITDTYVSVFSPYNA